LFGIHPIRASLLRQHMRAAPDGSCRWYNIR
jgi:hypothetical protein